MQIEIKVPQQGLTVDYVTLSRWLVKEGDSVTKGQELAEIESEKSVLMVEAPADGVLSSIVSEPGQEYDIGAVLGIIETA